MSKILHARIDEQTEKKLQDIKIRFGWNDSQVVRQGIKTLSSLLTEGRVLKIVGLGAFQSDVPDLGSNKRHLDGFGR